MYAVGVDQVGQPLAEEMAMGRLFGRHQPSAKHLSSIGDTLCRQRSWNAALQAYDRALALDPLLATAWNGRGWALTDLGRLEEALAALDRALEINPLEG